MSYTPTHGLLPALKHPAFVEKGGLYPVFYFCYYVNRMKRRTCFVKLKSTISMWPLRYSLFPRALSTREFIIFHLKIWVNARTMGFEQNALTTECSFAYVLKDMALECIHEQVNMTVPRQPL